MRGFQRPSLVLAGAAGAIVFGLGYAAWLGQYGSFAKSPQTVSLTLGGTVAVAGGRAKVWFGALDERVYVEFSQKGESRPLWLTTDEEPSEVYGLRVKLKDVSVGQPPRIQLEIRWDES